MNAAIIDKAKEAIELLRDTLRRLESSFPAKWLRPKGVQDYIDDLKRQIDAIEDGLPEEDAE